MNASGLPYRLRPAKFIDRELFADLISQIVALDGPNGWVYMSMAGAQMVDIQTIYRRAGIQCFYAFDCDYDIVERQKFNQSLPNVKFGHHYARDLPDRIDDIISDQDGRAIIWLDFTGSGERRDQLEDFIAVLNGLTAGDICRITLDAGHSLNSKLMKDYDESGEISNSRHRATEFRKMLDPYSSAHMQELDKCNLPRELLDCIRRACAKARGQRPEPHIRFVPLLLTNYADGANMVTATVRCELKDQPQPVPDGWPWHSDDWSCILEIQADVLSARERALIDKRLDDPEGAATELPFLDREVIKAYAEFHRYQPNFQNVIE